MRHIINSKKDTRYLFLDVETGNLCLNEIYNLPWQVSFISVVNNHIEKEWDFLLKWKEDDFFMSKGAAEATRYDHNKVQREGVAPIEALNVLRKEVAKSDYVCGHNIIGFDAYMILALCRKLKQEPINILKSPLDTLSIAKGIRINSFPKNEIDLISWQFRMHHYWKKGLNKLRLIDLGKEYGIDHDYDKLHDALVDLRLNIKIFNQQQKSFSYTD